MTVPARAALWLLAGLTALLLLAPVAPAVVGVALLGDALVLGAVLIEGRVLKRLSFSAARNWPARAQVHQSAELAFELTNRSRGRLSVTLRQAMPANVESEQCEWTEHVAPGERLRTAMAVTPHERGRVTFPPLEVNVRSPFGLAVRRTLVEADGAMTVYPDLASLWAYDRLRRSRALRQMGVHRQRQIGAGWEYEQLREYLPDDDYRNVNWKATARRQYPVTTLYQAERSRDVLLCLDCGRMMGNPIGQGTTLDHAINAAIMVAYASIREGDRVGAICFSDRPNTVLKPASGATGLHQVIESLVDAQAQPVFPSYGALVEAIRRQQSHRSLVLLFTDLNDPQLAGDLAELMPLLSRRHVVVTASLQDTALEQRAAEAAGSTEGLYEVLAARGLVAERAAHRRALKRAGVHVLETDAKSLSIQAVNQYMSIKSRQLL
jgi:uncharacterized protein (DUF58 family)